MIADGSIIARPGDDDPGAIALMHKLSAKSRERWPGFAVDDPRGPGNGKRGVKAQPVQA
jgi:coenzyme F420 hydrogenase subunit beta